jgi:hypothetical protein
MVAWPSAHAVMPVAERRMWTALGNSKQGGKSPRCLAAYEATTPYDGRLMVIAYSMCCGASYASLAKASGHQPIGT